MITSKQRSYLMSLANTLEPVISVGKLGLTEQVIKAIQVEFTHRELFKLRFQDFKDEKDTLAKEIAETTKCDLVRVIGHVAVYYKKSSDKDKQLIKLPN